VGGPPAWGMGGGLTTLPRKPQYLLRNTTHSLRTGRIIWHDLRTENRVLRRIFGPKRDEVTGEWRKLHNEELHNLYSSPDIVRQVKSRGMSWAGHVARMGGMRTGF
jgi:hypothetical protein